MNQVGERISLSESVRPLILIGDAGSFLRRLDPESVNLVVTSPPYWMQRDYGVEGQIGQEPTPGEYVQNIVKVAKGLRRVLKNEGSFFLNIGDKYVKKNLQMIPARVAIALQDNGWVLRNQIVWYKPNHMPTSITDRFNSVWEPVLFFVKDTGNYTAPLYGFDIDEIRIPHKSKEEERIDLPDTLSVEEYEKLDNKTVKSNYAGKFKGHEKNRGASPGARQSLYGAYYSLQRKHKISPELELGIIDHLRDARKGKGIATGDIDDAFGYKDTAGHWFRRDRGGRCLPKPEDWPKLKEMLDLDDRFDDVVTNVHYVLQTVRSHPKGKNPGDMWSIKTDKLTEAHFAIFPEELVRRIIKAACPKGGVVLDPFAGSGTVGKVAMELGRKSILIDINPEYEAIMKRRCGIDVPSLESFDGNGR